MDNSVVDTICVFVKVELLFYRNYVDNHAFN